MTEEEYREELKQRELRNVVRGSTQLLNKIKETGQSPTATFCPKGLGPLDHTTYLGSQNVGAFAVHLDNGSETRDYHFDAVNEKNTLQYTTPLTDKDELYINLNFFSATEDGGINPAQWLVSEYLGMNDPFDRERYGMNKALKRSSPFNIVIFETIGARSSRKFYFKAKELIFNK